MRDPQPYALPRTMLLKRPHLRQKQTFVARAACVATKVPSADL